MRYAAFDGATAMITDNPVFKRLISTGEEQIGRFASQLVSNERFMSSVQTAVTSALSAKGVLDQKVTNAIQALKVPTTADVKKVNDRLDELERIFEGLSDTVDGIAEALTASKTQAAAEATVEEPAEETVEEN